MKSAYRIGNCIAQLIEITDDTWMLTHIGTPNLSGWRNQGDGERTLSLVCAEADLEEVTLVLSVQPDPDTDRERLTNWYGRHGFALVINDDAHRAMIRLPA